MMDDWMKKIQTLFDKDRQPLHRMYPSTARIHQLG